MTHGPARLWPVFAAALASFLDPGATEANSAPTASLSGLRSVEIAVLGPSARDENAALLASLDARVRSLGLIAVAPGDPSASTADGTLRASVHASAARPEACVVVLSLERRVALAREPRGVIDAITWQRVEPCDGGSAAPIVGARDALERALELFARDLQNAANAALTAMLEPRVAAPLPVTEPPPSAVPPAAASDAPLELPAAPPAPVPAPAQAATSPLAGLRRLTVGAITGSGDVERFREALIEELARVGFEVVPASGSPDATLEAELIVETIPHAVREGAAPRDRAARTPSTTRTSATVALRDGEGRVIWEGRFEASGIENPLRSPVRSRAREAAAQLSHRESKIVK